MTGCAARSPNAAVPEQLGDGGRRFGVADPLVSMGALCAEEGKEMKSLVLLFALIAGFAASTAQAASYLKASNSIQICDWTVNPNESYSNAWETYGNASTGPVFHSEDITFHGARAITQSSADFGSLGFYARSMSLGDYVTAYADGSARFVDSLTINSPSLGGQPGQLHVWVDVDGSIDGPILHPGVSGGATWRIQLVDSYYSGVDQWNYSTNSGRTSYHGYLLQNVSFTYGQPFDLAIDFFGSAGARTGAANYLNAARFNLPQSQVLNPDGVPIANYTVTAASGHNYLVPEPMTLSLLLLGGLAMCRRTHRQQS